MEAEIGDRSVVDRLLESSQDFAGVFEIRVDNRLDEGFVADREEIIQLAAMTANSSVASIGFVILKSMPASRHFFSVSAVESAVRPMMGTCFRAPSI